MKLKELLGRELILLDGGMGSSLQQRGMKAGEAPELLNITNPQLIIDIHKGYYESGANIVYTNTFGANSLKAKEQNYNLEEVVKAGIENAKAARDLVDNGRQKFVALDIGPLGKLLKPIGDLDFEEAVSIFKEVVSIGMEAGVDLITIETMSDTYELKAAVLAAKEVSDLPIIATVAFSEDKRLLNGADVKTVVALLEGLRVDGLGLNCGLDPRNIMDLVEEFVKYSSLPVVVKPNAGIPENVNGKIRFNLEAKNFGAVVKPFVEMGISVVGGCCGTTSEHIQNLYDHTRGMKVKAHEPKGNTIVSSYSKSVVCEGPIIVGERINPTGKKLLKEALINKDFSYILREAIGQEEQGAEILDVNVGLNDIDEVDMMVRTMESIQEISTLPLQIDSSKAGVVEKALRLYNGKAMLNSVNGKQESMEAVFPIISKYGAVVVALTLDEEGIPPKAEDRYKIAEKIINRAKEYGIDKKDIVIDPLCMTISTDKNAANETLKALSMIREGLGVKTILGVSNISFGLPERDLINQSFFTMALKEGLDFGIINPLSQAMMRAYDGYKVLAGLDNNGLNYIAKYSQEKKEVSPVVQQNISLYDAIKKGFKEDCFNIAKDMLKTKAPLDIISEALIPALDEVGLGFEQGRIFLPQLMMSADAASRAFDALKESLNAMDKGDRVKEKIVIATVKGDIHDIGKNIVKVLLENYGYQVIDLGKDVDYNLVLDTVLKEGANLVGLSALMTTTVDNMQTTIERIREQKPNTKIMVGGAVLTKDYAMKIGADRYCKDAMDSVRYAKEVFTN
ncbi:MAG: homocysteine S-methyltransferase family protein [Filifactoraceae bacterium]